MEQIKITSVAFADGASIPKDHTGEGRNVSPPLEWSGVPAGAKELVVMLEDADGLAGNFSHWLVYGIAPDARGLPEALIAEAQVTLPTQAGAAGALPSGSRLNGPRVLQGLNSFVKIGYGGPMPGVGSGPHRYQFRVFALDRPTGLGGGQYKEDVQKEMAGHVIARGTLTGIYERRAAE
jgi:Raf kinase inhibitor-like YbhB/YbcL family protein